jgi:3-hydroxybutyrate dehydrogenase
MLKGKTAIVTGSTSGIGLDIARTLAEKECNILLNGFADAKEINTLKEEFKKSYKGKVDYCGADMSKPKEIEDMVKQAEKTFGAVDILVNNAGIQYTAPIEKFPPEKWDTIIAINLSASFHTIRHVLPGMQKRNYGRIINIASAHGLVASVHKAAYIAAKHGLVGLTKVVALENATSQITCNAICPGWVKTPLVEKQIESMAQEQKISIKDAEFKLLSEKQPSLRFVQTSQIGGLVLFLVSDAASNMTGSSVSIDGGWTAC